MKPEASTDPNSVNVDSQNRHVAQQLALIRISNRRSRRVTALSPSRH